MAGRTSERILPERVEEALSLLEVDLPGFRGEFTGEKLKRWQTRVVTPAYAAKRAVLTKKLADIESDRKKFLRANHPDRFVNEPARQLAAQQACSENDHKLNEQAKGVQAAEEKLEAAYQTLITMIWNDTPRAQRGGIDPPQRGVPPRQGPRSQGPPPRPTQPPPPAETPPLDIQVVIVINGVPMRRRGATPDLSDALRRFLEPILRGMF